MTAARRLARNFATGSRGADVVFYGTLPRAAGLSTTTRSSPQSSLVLGDVKRPAALGQTSLAAIPDDLSPRGLSGLLSRTAVRLAR